MQQVLRKEESGKGTSGPLAFGNWTSVGFSDNLRLDSLKEMREVANGCICGKCQVEGTMEQRPEEGESGNSLVMWTWKDP